MSTREIFLDGGSPWGFRMHGGADVGQPVRISRVNPGSKAAQKGVREGDVISSINGQSTRNITNSDAHALLRNAGQTLHLGLNEECSGSPKRRIHRNIQQESKSECVKRCSATKTTTTSTTVRTASASLNCSTDANCNSQIPTKGDLKDGQNGGVKESSTVSTTDSKGQRRRRRQQSTPQSQLPEVTKGNCDTITSKVSRSVTSSEGTGSKSRRRRRSRGNSRRKCRAGNALVVESDVSGTEQKAEELDKEMSTTEPETDATMSDIGGKAEGDNAHRGETSEVETEDVVTEKLLIREEVSSVHIKDSVREIVHENRLSAGGSSSEVGDIANDASLAIGKGSVLEGTRKEDVSRAILNCNKGEKAVPLVDVKSTCRLGIKKEQFSFEGKLSDEISNTGTGNVQVSERRTILRDNVEQEMTEIDIRLKKSLQVQEIDQGKKSNVDVGSEASNTGNVIDVHHQKDVTEVDISIIGRGGNENKINEDEDKCEKSEISSCMAACENVLLSDGKHVRGSIADRTEFLIEDGKRNCCRETAEYSLKSGVPSSELKDRRYVTVVKAVDISDMKTDHSNVAEEQNSITGGKIEDSNFYSKAIECNVSLSDNDIINLQCAEEFGLSDECPNSRRSPADSVTVEELISPGNHQDVEEITDGVNFRGTVSDVLMKTSDGIGKNSCKSEIYGHEQGEFSSESSVSNDSNYVRKHVECSDVTEVCSTKADASRDDDVAGPFESGDVRTTGSNSQPTLCAGVNGDAEVTLSVKSDIASEDESVVRVSEVSAEITDRRPLPQQKDACLISEHSSPECKAVVLEAVGDEVWEEVVELPSTGTFREDDRLSEGVVPGGDERRRLMTNSPVLVQNTKLSQEEKELLDPRPLVDAEDEETLRRFIHSLNLADYSKEAVRARSVILKDGSTIEEMYAARRGRRRAPLETYCSLQRGLDVILEENSSDYSDGEKRVEGARVLEDRPRDKAWEEAIFIPETSELLYLSSESDEGGCENLDVMGSAESGIRNRSLYYSETVEADGMGNGESVCRVYQRVENESRRVTTRIISEEVSIDVFSEEMEQTLENVGETQEYDSEDDDDGEGTGKVVCGGGTGVTVELAESSDDEDVKGTWKRGRTQEMQDAVEIVYLEEDSGSTSSSSCKATKQNEGEAADDADAEEEDPDVLYEGVEFPVVGAGNTVDVTGGDKGNSSKTSIGSAVYENVEFHRNTEAVLTTEQRNSDIPVNLEESANCVNEFSSDIYEDVEFVNLMSLPRNPNVIPYSDSGHYDSTHACVLNDDPNRVTEQITEGDEIVDSGRERDKEDEGKSSGQSMPEIECSSELESTAQVNDDGNIKEVLSDVRCHESKFFVETDYQSIEQRKVGKVASETVIVDNPQINSNSKTVDIVKRILCLLPQRESIDNGELKSIISQLTSESTETKSLKESVAGRSEADGIEKDTRLQREINKKSPQIPPHIEADATLSISNIYCQELGCNPNTRKEQSDLGSKSPRMSPETITGHGSEAVHDKRSRETNYESFRTPCQIDSRIRMLNEGTQFGHSENSVHPEALQYNPALKSASTAQKESIEQERSNNVFGEYEGLRDDDDGVDDLYSITPTNRSRPGSSSSDAGSHGTAVYCPGRFSPQSSDADISSYAEDTVAENKPVRNKIYSPLNIRNRTPKNHSHENVSESKKNISPTFRTETEINSKMSVSPKTLKDLSVAKVMSLPRGVHLLNVLGIRVLLRSPEKNYDNKKCVNVDMQYCTPPVSVAFRAKDKPLLSGSLPDISSVQQETTLRDQSVKSPLPPVILSPSPAKNDWLGMPTKEDPNLMVCLSPSQRRSYQGEVPTPEEAGYLLDLHRKFIQRRGYHENPHPPPCRRASGISNETPLPNYCPSDKCLHRECGCRKPASSSEAFAESGETSPAFEPIPPSKFRTLLASLDSKIHSKGNTREVIGGLVGTHVEERKELGLRINEGKEKEGGGEKERGYDTSRSRLLAILRASSEPQEMQTRHLPPSSSCSPPPLPPLPQAYEHQVAMLGFLQQHRRPATFCCTSDQNDFEQRPSSHPSPSSGDSDLQSPTVKSIDYGKTSSRSNTIEGSRNRKENVSSWNGQGVSDENNKERLKVRSLSDWLHLVRYGGGTNKDTGGTQSKDSTPPVSACVSTQSSPGPIRRAIKDPSPKPETQKKEISCMKEYQKLKRDILERRFSLPERQLEQAYQPEQKLVKPPMLPTSARDDERHEQQLKLLQQRQQRQQMVNKTRPPLPQQQSKQKSTERELETQEIFVPVREEQKQESIVVQEEQHVERRFDADNYRISKKGDIAIINSSVTTRVSKDDQSIVGRKETEAEKNVRQMHQHCKSLQRPKSMPPPVESLVTGGEIFRQQMYLEYMNEVAERSQRRRQKVIRLSSVPRDEAPASEGKDTAPAATVQQLENEFMGKVRERMDKLGLECEEVVDDGTQNKTESGTDNCYVISGGGASHGVGGGGTSVSQLPKHLQEFLVFAGATDSDVNSDVDGVWSPSLKPSSDITEDSDAKNNQDKRTEGDDAPPVVWTPKSAGASPTTERKEFRPISFQSPTLPRKNRSATSDDIQPGVTTSSVAQEPTSTTSLSSVFPPWQHQQSRDDSTLSFGSTVQSPTSDKSVASSTIASTLDRRLVQSQSAPASGLSALAAGGPSSNKLPRAQNPTITLLQKAREGQLPRGALYLDHKMNSKEEDKSYISQNEILYTVKKEYESKGETDQRKKIVELGPRKFEGIGPMTKEGIPIVLRSEVKDANQAKWYKRMYDSLHRTGKDDEYVTIRYKPRRGHYPYTSPGGYLSEPEPGLYDSDIGYSAKYATLDRRRIRNKENDFTTSTLPRSRYVPHPASIKYATEVYKNQPGRIEDYEPGHSSISDKETKQWWDEVLDIFDGQATAEPQTTPSTPLNKPFMAYALKDGYESDSTLVFKRRDENLQNQLSPAEQKLAYKTIQKGGEVPLHGLRKLAPERPKESPHRYVESEVTIHYRSPVRSEAKEVLSEEELARRQAEAMRRIYQEERRRKYLHELQDMNSRRHTDNFTPSQKSPIPLNRYDDFLDDVGYKGKPRDRTPEPKLVARALYNFVGQTSRELSFRRGDIIFVRRQIDKNWYEGEHNAMVGLFPFNYVEIIPYDGIRTIPKLPNEGQARAKFNFIAQTHLELSLVKGELVVLTRRVDDNWFEGRIGNRKGIFPVSYVEVLSEPGEKPGTPVAPLSKPITLPASHTVLMNGSGIKQSMGHHSYQPSSYYSQNKMASSYTSSNPYATLPRQSQTLKQPLAPVNQTLHIDTHSEPVPYRALYNYRPQNEDELELCEGDTVYVMEKCDDGWYVGSSQRTGYFGTFPGNYVERI